MIDYSRNPHGDVVWLLGDNTGVQTGKHRVARIDLSHYLRIVAHTDNEAEFRARLWQEVTIKPVKKTELARMGFRFEIKPPQPKPMSQTVNAYYYARQP